MSVTDDTAPSHLQKRLVRDQGNWLLTASWPWRITVGYLVVMLLLPAIALIAKSVTVGPSDFWRI
ncbi:MAG: sulfate ABC transporter permease subunit CysT, partial [Coleofasciculus sp. S288]|nr:sulfate ABC transporter permease subunit CysT [Coleofasciculus sp. S288]